MESSVALTLFEDTKWTFTEVSIHWKKFQVILNVIHFIDSLTEQRFTGIFFAFSMVLGAMVLAVNE